MFRATLMSVLLTTAAFAQGNCNQTVRQTSQLNPGWWCSTVTYTYEVCNSASCVLPISKVCIKFPCGVDQLDAGSAVSPAGWAATVDPVGNQVCWNAVVRANQIQPGQCRTFSITTNCNPRCLEGIQRYDLFAEFGVPIQQDGTARVAFAGNYRTFVTGDLDAQLGSIYTMSVASALEPGQQVFLFASPLADPVGTPLASMGLLHLDPLFAFPFAPLPLDPHGTGLLPLPIPMQPTLSGVELMFQAVSLTPTSPQLSNLHHVTLR